MAVTAQGLVPIAQVSPRDHVRVCGRVITVEVAPADAAPTLIARVDDGTGRIDAVFMGRRDVPGVEPGQQISLEGRVSDAGSVLCFYNPRFELQCRA